MSWTSTLSCHFNRICKYFPFTELQVYLLWHTVTNTKCYIQKISILSKALTNMNALRVITKVILIMLKKKWKFKTFKIFILYYVLYRSIALFASIFRHVLIFSAKNFFITDIFLKLDWECLCLVAHGMKITTM